MLSFAYTKKIKMKKHKIIFGFLFLVLVFGCSKLKKLTKNEYLEKKVFITIIPFKYVDMLMIIEAEIEIHGIIGNY